MPGLCRSTSCLPVALALVVLVNVSPSSGEDKTTAATADNPSATFRVGGAYADITPQRSMPNYKGDPLNPDRDACPLRVQVIVCADATSKVALISVDCTFLGRTEVGRMREALHRRLGLKPEHVCIAATHSHASPATTASFLTGELPDPKYIDLLVEKTCGAVEQAISRMRRAGGCGVDRLTAGRRVVAVAAAMGQAYMPGTEPKSTFQAENPIDEEMQYAVFEDSMVSRLP